MHTGFAMLVACGPVVLLVVSVLVGGLLMLALYAVALHGLAILFDQNHRGVAGSSKERFWGLDPPAAITPASVPLIGQDD